MPNHVSNEIKITGQEERVAEFFAQAKSSPIVTGARQEELREFSFCGFVPPPNDPDYTSNGCSHGHWGYERSGEIDPNPNCWYAWNPTNWGTKWDAYSVGIGREHTVLDRLARADADASVVEETVQFQTAWAPPTPVFKKIAELYPDCKFEFRWMNEDMYGHGGGYVHAANGELGAETDRVNNPDCPETGALWWALARELRGHTQAMHDDYLAEMAEDERLTAEAEAASNG